MSARTSPSTIALLSMPIMIKAIMRGRMFQMLLGTVLSVLWALIADSEMCAMTWFPVMIALQWQYCNAPRRLPPERDKGTCKKKRSAIFSWLTDHCPELWCTAWNTTRLRLPEPAGAGMLWQKNCAHRYQTYSPSRVRKSNRGNNR
jgi:hypothetical protein